MKIVYLITAYDNYLHLERLINALDDQFQPHFFIHIDKKSPMPEKLIGRERVIFIKRIKVWWGGWSHMKAILSLVKEAFQYNFDYYVLISGSDYPIRPNSFLYQKLRNGGEYLNLIKGYELQKSHDRIKYYYFDHFDRRNRRSLKTKFYLKLEKMSRKIFKKKSLPFPEIFHGSTWWALSHSMITSILKMEEQYPELRRFFRTSWCPEESFFPTIIGNFITDKELKNNLTFTDWSTNPAPASITKNHIKMFKEQSCFNTGYGNFTPFFARKFSDSSIDLIREIEADLRLEIRGRNSIKSKIT